MAAMRRGDDVSRAERPAGTDGCRFLPDRQMDEAGYLAVAEELRDALLEAPDEQHPAMHLEELVKAGAHAVTVTTGTPTPDAEVMTGMTGSRRTVVITGAGGALGSALSRQFAGEPATDLVLE